MLWCCDYVTTAVSCVVIAMILNSWRKQASKLPQHLTIRLGIEKRLPVDQVGGKAASLNDLLFRKFPVPKGIVLTTHGTRNMLHLSLQTEQHFSELDSFKDTIQNADVPREAMVQISAFVKEFPTNQLFAVRSSGVYEDMEDKAFAGAYESFLEVKPDEIEARIKDCIASQYTPDVCTYLKHSGISMQQMSMAVLVQPQVDAELSGVCFTSAPTRGPWHLAIDVERGLAGGTHGRSTPKHYNIERGTGALDTEESSAYEESITPEVVAITQEVVWKVAKLALQIEELRGGAMEPRDIEFAVNVKQEVFILQDRPDTVGRSRIRHFTSKYQSAVDARQNKITLQDQPSTDGSSWLRKYLKEWLLRWRDSTWESHDDKFYFPGGTGIPSLHFRPVAKGVVEGFAALASGSALVENMSYLEANHQIFKSSNMACRPHDWLLMLMHQHRCAAARQWETDVDTWHETDRSYDPHEVLDLQWNLKNDKQMSDQELLEFLRKAELYLKENLKGVKQMDDQKLFELLKKAEFFVEKASWSHRHLNLAAVMPYAELMLFCKDQVPGFNEKERLSLSMHLMYEGERARSIFTALDSNGKNPLKALVLVLNSSEGSRIRSQLHNKPPKSEMEAQSYMRLLETDNSTAKEFGAWRDAVGHWIERGTITDPTKAEKPLALMLALRSQLQGIYRSSTDDDGDEDVVASLKARLKPELFDTFEQLVGIAKKANSIREGRFVSASAAVGLFRLFLLEAGRRCSCLEDEALILEAESLDNVEKALHLKDQRIKDQAAFVQLLQQRKNARLSTNDAQVPPVLPIWKALQANPRNWKESSRSRKPRIIMLQQALRWFSAFPLARFARICIEYKLQDSGIESESPNSVEIKGVLSKDELRGKAISSNNIVQEGKARVGIKGLEPDEILVVEETDVTLNHVFPMLKGLVTERGGILSHAAITAREYLNRGQEIACVVQVTDACSKIHTGDMLQINAKTGIVKILKKNMMSML